MPRSPFRLFQFNHQNRNLLNIFNHFMVFKESEIPHESHGEEPVCEKKRRRKPKLIFHDIVTDGCLLFLQIKATNVTLRSQIEDLLNRQYLLLLHYVLCVHVLHMYYTCVSTVEVTTLMLSLYLRFTTKTEQKASFTRLFLGNFPLLFQETRETLLLFYVPYCTI